MSGLFLPHRGRGTACKAVEGGNPPHRRWRHAPSTPLRAVPFPRFDGEE